MSDNYTLFSEVINELTEEEIDWLKQQLEYVPRDDQDDLPRFMHEAIKAGDDEFLEPDNGLDFGFQFQDRSLWLYSEECGSPAHAAVLVQRFLKKFRPQDYWLINWAATSSRLRIGEFGGGGMLVTANQIFAESGWSFIERKLEELGLAGNEVGPSDPVHDEENRGPRFAEVAWKASDVQSLFDVTWNQAEEFLNQHARQIQDAMIERGWEVIELLGDIAGIDRADADGASGS